MLINNLLISVLEATDLEIGIFNCTIDYANTNKIQLSWKCSLFIDTYINISRSIYSNLKSNSYIGNNNLYKRLVENKEFVPHMLPYMQCHNIFPERWKDIIVKFTGKITVPSDWTSVYFAGYTDDGFKMYVDGNLAINNWVEQGSTWSPYSPIYNVSQDKTLDVALKNMVDDNIHKLSWWERFKYAWKTAK